MGLFLHASPVFLRHIAQTVNLFFGDYSGGLSLTLFRKSGKVNKMNAMMKTSTCHYLFSENCRLVQGSKKDDAEYLSERLC